MANVFRPKIKIDTVRDTARKMAATQTGKQISQTKFKQFLKTDKSTRGMVLRSGSMHITKTQAQKFMGTVVKKIDETKGMKLSMYARKMGIKQGNVTPIGLKKAYEAGARAEIKAEAPTGPSKEELARQQRIERGRQILSRRDRAEEIRKEYQARTSPRPTSPTYQPTQLMHGSGAARAGQSNVSLSRASTLTGRQRPGTSLRAGGEDDANAVVLSFHSKARMQELSLLGEKLEETLRRALASVPIIHLLSKVKSMKALRTLGWESGNIVTSEFAKKIGTRFNIEYIFFGTIQHQPIGAHVELFLFLISENSLLKVADIVEDYQHTFEIEKRLTWQVQKFFEEKSDETSTGSGVSIPSPTEAEDLPI
ncbi:MAG: hypothetical protein UY52_C0004G0049 [Parcubacteria group bacterium GW2011_GWC2_49_9]|nr:MAG: hypothetical protein UY52_C0004G0049 [Parcubacteria group bacterium GW2011_GWC2_49_9]